MKNDEVEKREVTVNSTTRFEKINGYFVNNSVAFEQDFKFLAISNQKDFDKYFGIGKTMQNEVTNLDFDKFNVAAILTKPSIKTSTIKIEKYTANGAKSIVGFTHIIGKEQTHTSSGMLLFKIPKSRTSIDFIFDGTTVNIPVQ